MNHFFKIFFLVLLFCGCKKDHNDKDSDAPKSKNNSDLLLDKNVISSYFETNSENENIKNEVYLFYKNRGYQFAWFNQKGMSQAVPNFQNQLQLYSNDFHDNTINIAQIDTLITIIKTSQTNQKVDEKQRSNAELLLTTTFFKYSEKAFTGTAKNLKKLDWFIPRYKKNYQTVLDSLVLKDNSNKTYEPVNIYYSKLKEKLRLYRDIQKQGGFPLIKTDRKLIAVTESDSCLIPAKKRLFLSGDLVLDDKTIVFTDALETAVTHFQQRLGLPENGKLNTKTIVELNKTVDFRIKQMLINLERLRWVPVEVENDYLLVNIPEYKLHVFENKKLIWQTNVVVGKEAKQTNIFRGKISKIVLNPYWNIPTSIIAKEILPDLKRGPSYLSRNNMEAVSGGKVLNAKTINWNKYSKNVPFQIRQKPGVENSLGKMKFLFPNNFNIYLHDTPSKDLFDKNKRDFSHGCIRVENPAKLALYLLRNDKNWPQNAIDNVLKTNIETEIKLLPTMPVYITYFTAWVDSKGNLNFRNDIYNLDDALGKEIFDDQNK